MEDFKEQNRIITRHLCTNMFTNYKKERNTLNYGVRR